MTTLDEALAAVRIAPAGSLKLSRIVAYALGDGDSVSRKAFEAYGPAMHPEGQPRKGPVWMPPQYTEALGMAGKPLPDGWELFSGGSRECGYSAWAKRFDMPESAAFQEFAATETLARLAAALRARIEATADLEALLS